MFHKFILFATVITFLQLYSHPRAYSQGSGDSFTLFEQTMRSHPHCKIELDRLVKKSATKLQKEPISIKDEKNILKDEGQYLLLIRPNANEVMVFECKNKNLKIQYHFAQ